ncbi:proteoglycan 4 [Biomphalaria glabrata]|uniref:Uncharacterized protein LOC106060893 n=1 Tax=Biomphalaria glabrata TaxID=6526 RepID=A0A2C9JN88_BIOGL|nr:uncharacterized protein LOC106060893 [Biomphalaria glabrata]XP_013074372.1 uncharacterized protein LOC106060893 [Biomphalaria glabrata]KAI8758387.1 proteoglycan 4-like [Biomphalaria glabrata]KAI8791900.1 proteoglycan 4 [Biomphalaria glabrata]
METYQTAAKVHDPMYNFDTHFPERLSRLHLHGDFNASGSFRKKKSRAQRSGARYKTQPVTFDEIKEVDEEPMTPVSPEQTGSTPEQLKGQLQAFSRSMDGLLPKGVSADQSPPQYHFSRSGSRKFQRHPDCIPEKAEIEPVTPQPVAESQPLRLSDTSSPFATTFATTATTAAPKSPSTPSPLTPTTPKSPASLTPGGVEPGGEISPIPSPNMASRRLKVTAKAKKRQKALEDSDI